MDPLLVTGAAAGAVLTILTVAGLAWRGTRRVGRVADAILGTPTQDGLPARPGLVEQVELLRGEVAQVRSQQIAHLSWHATQPESGLNGHRPAPVPDHL